MIDTRVASRYARAVFIPARAQNLVPVVEEELNGVCAVIENSEDLQQFLGNPNVSRADRMKMYEKLFSDRVTALTMSLLRLLVNKGRESEISTIRDEFVRLRREQGQIVPVLVESARELSADQSKAIIDKVAQATGRTVEPTFEVRPDLIGGVRVTFDNQVIDGSARGNLTRMREHIINDVLKQA
ncbi:MAG: ATP synthase F1 subunit delta [Fimbriimonadaceae bacterium]|nr:ATP synthase F1 subunit delta [Fimbriimonadaceae bacterium]